MITNLDCAYLSDDVYCFDDKHDYSNHFYTPKTKFIKNNWIGLYVPNTKGEILNPDHSFFARLYANQHTQETVIAYRGTAKNKYGLVFPSEIRDDYRLAHYESNPQDQKALNFYQNVKLYFTNCQNVKTGKLIPKINIAHLARFPVLTGHSLGGYLAQYVAYKNPGTKAIVFNAPGIGNFQQISAKNCHSSITNIVIDNDLIHLAGKQIANVVTLKGNPYNFCKVPSQSWVSYFYDQHKIVTEIGLLQSNHG